MQNGKLLYEYQYKLSPKQEVLEVFQSRNRFFVNGHLPQLDIDIEFRKGKFKLKGDKDLLISDLTEVSIKSENELPARLEIETDLFPACALDLYSSEQDTLVFALNGILQDVADTRSCSGLLILDNERFGSRFASVQWYLKFFLYEYTFGNYEISFKLPLYLQNHNYDLN